MLFAKISSISTFGSTLLLSFSSLLFRLPATSSTASNHIPISKSPNQEPSLPGSLSSEVHLLNNGSEWLPQSVLISSPCMKMNSGCSFSPSWLDSQCFTIWEPSLKALASATCSLLLSYKDPLLSPM